VDSFGRLLWWLFAGSAGAVTRVRVVRALRSEPRNAQQLSLALQLDYTTVRHHLDVLSRNRLLEVGGERYGQVYFLAPSLEQRWAEVEAILARRAGFRRGD
jgi:DNA-binding transcriptional ArsR family regulator